MAERTERVDAQADERADGCNDDALLARIAAGDHDALHALYARYHPRLWRYLWRRLGGQTGAVEDALQEIWLAVWRAAPGYRPQGQATAWIFQIASRHLSHAWRDRSRRAEGYLAPDALDPAGETQQSNGTLASPGSTEERVLDRLTLADALRRLSPRHREVLDLVFQQGFTLAEVAEILDVPLGTVKSRVSYARRALSEALAIATSQEETAP